MGNGRKKVLVLGGSGMLGSMVADVLSRDPAFEVSATVRDPSHALRLKERIPGADWRLFEAGGDAMPDLFSSPERVDWVINAIGVIKQHIKEDNPLSTEKAIRVNALLPHRLAAAAGEKGFRVIQIATDCVFSGKEGGYTEDSAHDPSDVYGKTKSLGEVRAEGMHHVRCSIIGPEPKGRLSLLEWFLRQPEQAEVTGFLNHRWNGVTTLQFAKVCAGIIRDDLPLTHCRHLVPEGSVSKAEMLELFAAVFGRRDIRIRRGNAASAVDRTLATVDAGASARLWTAAGYAKVPTVPEMVEELSAYPFRPTDL